MANNRIAYGLCKEYGIDLPKDATPSDAWKALEDKGITQDEAFQKAAKTTKQGTSYESIIKNDVDDDWAKEDKQRKSLVDTFAKVTGYTPATWEVDDLVEGYDGDYSKASMEEYANSLKGQVTPDEKPKNKSLPKSGPKLHNEFIDYVKDQIGLDLTPVRDTMFDNRKSFNIDTREIASDKLRELKNLASRSNSYKVNILDNGANRLAIYVSRK